MKIQKLKQIVYLPVKVEDEFPDGECVMISKTHDMLVGYPADVNGEIQADDAHQILRYITHWLKEQEGYFFTSLEIQDIFTIFTRENNISQEKVKIFLNDNFK